MPYKYERTLYSCRSNSTKNERITGEGLSCILNTKDFGCWQAAVSASLGYHSSELLCNDSPFAACFHIGQLGGFTLLHMRGEGRLRLKREQHQCSVLWLPLCGLSEECINGHAWLAEPGMGLLFHPGDAMVGETSRQVEGVSILIPPDLIHWPPVPHQPLLWQGPLHQAILSCARRLVAVAANQPAGAEHAADQLSDALHAWSSWIEHPPEFERITSRRRRSMVGQAQEWMATRLTDRFEVGALSQAMNVSIRQLQYSFLQELGHSPMAEAKRLRLQRLRNLLLDPAQNQRSIAELMTAAGLIASGVTSADYRGWCGESPRETRLKIH